MGRWVVIAAITGLGSAGCAKPPHVPVAPAPPACAAPPAAPAPTAAKVAAAPDTLAALAPGDAERMAVVVLMVPGGGDPSVPKQRHEYKLSLAADADSAAVEVDGQPMGAARVQHLSSASLAGLRTRAATAPSPRPAVVRPRPPAPEAMPVRAQRLRIVPTTMQPASFVPPPNGAPIID